jgi:hypothetical protein
VTRFIEKETTVNMLLTALDAILGVMEVFILFVCAIAVFVMFGVVQDAWRKFMETHTKNADVLDAKKGKDKG